jgi:hypothetical protein
MRTTITIDDDIAAEIARIRRNEGLGLKDVINDLLREGARAKRPPVKKRKPFRTEPIANVTPLLANFDNIAEVIALVEGEFYK